MKKRWISLLLVFAMVLGVVPVPTQAAMAPNDTLEIIDSGYCGTEGVNEDNVAWTLYSDGTLKLTGHGRMKDYSITNWTQSPWYGYRSRIKAVVAEGIENIGSIAFYGGDFKIESVTLGDSVQSVGWMAFTFTGTLKTVEFGTGIQRIEGDAFGQCGNLTTVTFPGSSLSYLSGNAFNSCSNLNAVHITDLDAWCNVEYETLQSNPLYYAKNLYLNGELVTEVTYPEGSQYVHGAAFANCKSLEKVTIPDGVQVIGPYAFFGCEKLNEISIADSVTLLDYEAFKNCTSLSSINLPNSLETIGGNAFYGCTALREITIPDNVTQIGNGAFQDCTALSSAILSNSLVSIGENAFRYCSSLECVIIPKTVTSVGKNAFYNCGSMESVVISDGVISIGDYAFHSCYNLKSVTIPNSVTSIGRAVFDSCNGLTSAIIGNGITSVSEYLFSGCSALTSVVIHDSVTTIGEWAFAGCSGLTGIEIPDSVISIGARAFAGCSGLTGIEIPDNIITLGTGVFMSCSGLTSVIIGNGITSISDALFNGCSALTSVNIPDTVTTIGSGAFGGCTSLSEVTIPDSVTTIGSSAFGACDSLISVVIPDGIAIINEYTFGRCSSLINVVIPDSVTAIESDAFSFCFKLENLVIPGSVTYIGDQAFLRCESLDRIVIPDGVTTIGEFAFSGCIELCYVIFSGDAPVFENGVFRGVTATAYYPANNPTWTADVMQDYGGTITWAPYDPAAGLPTPGKHSTIAELTTEDYLAFSAIAYKQMDLDGATVEQCLKEKNHWNKKWSTKFGFTYADLCKYIADWRIEHVTNLSSYDGFYAVIFTNDIGEAVVAYRGSKPLTSVDNVMTWDAYCDWLLNDLPLELGNNMGPQLDSAFSIYKDVLEIQPNREKIVLTGHSLGGAWADTVSAYSGIRAVTFNSVSILDVLFKEEAERMAETFDGVDLWAFLDHTNKNDILAGMFEHYFSTEMKPYVSHKGNIIVDVDYLGGLIGSVIGALMAGPGGVVVGGVIGSTADEIAACHGMESLVVSGANGDVKMSAAEDSFIPLGKITNYMLTKNHSIDLGTSRSNTINESMTALVSRTSYGGAGDDNIITSVRSDTIIGGPDDSFDVLDGGWGDDTYIYWIGDGYDKIWDTSGMDTLKICGAPAASSITSKINDDTDMVDIYCNGQMIASIYRKNRHNTNNTFLVSCDGAIRNITSDLLVAKYSASLRIGCPVNVEVLDPDGNVVHTLTDGEVGTWYTDYGNFYVFEEENGEYGKVLDLVEGYTARIVGAGEGTMDVTYQVPVDGELTEPVSVSNVPVTEELIATVEENEEGDVYLIVDSDGDGETDSEKKLYAECPFEDVTSSDYYYEPVLWAVDEGITDGVTETEFAPEDTCKRSQVVTFLWRAAGEPKAASRNNPFVDVKSTDYFYEAVLWAVEKGITDGMDETHFEPDGVCNRSQVVTFLYRTFGEPPVGSAANPFTDVPSHKWYATPVLWAVKEGITDGVTETSFAPENPCTRGQVVTFLYRAYN